MFRKSHHLATKVFTIPINEILTSSINVYELYFGVLNHPDPKKAEEIEIKYRNFLDTIKIVNFDVGCAKICSKIKTKLKQTGFTIEEYDMLIAAIALSNNLTLVTNNTKHFERIEGLRLDDWTLDLD